MSRVALRRQSIRKGESIIKDSSKSSVIEFRWSTSAARFLSPITKPLSPLPPIKRKKSPRKISPSTGTLWSSSSGLIFGEVLFSESIFVFDGQTLRSFSSSSPATADGSENQINPRSQWTCQSTLAHLFSIISFWPTDAEQAFSPSSSRVLFSVESSTE